MRVVVYIIFLCLTLGCSKNPAAYNVFKTVGDDGWHVDEPLEFVVDSLPEAMPHSVALQVRMARSECYPYKNIVVEVERWAQGDAFKTVDTLDLVLNFSEQSVMFETHSFPIDTLNGSKKCVRYVVRHLMVPDRLKGVTHVGMEVI